MGESCWLSQYKLFYHKTYQALIIYPIENIISERHIRIELESSRLISRSVRNQVSTYNDGTYVDKFPILAQ